jgi:hypothetical protein
MKSFKLKVSTEVQRFNEVDASENTVTHPKCGSTAGNIKIYRCGQTVDSED